jgi:hypothetical protein
MESRSDVHSMFMAYLDFEKEGGIEIWKVLY